MLPNNQFHQTHLGTPKYTLTAYAAKAAASATPATHAHTLLNTTPSSALFGPSVSAIGGFGKQESTVDTSYVAVGKRVRDSVESFEVSEVGKFIDTLDPALANRADFAEEFSHRAVDLL